MSYCGGKGQFVVIYPTAIRGLGVGTAIAVGRMGSVVGPLGVTFEHYDMPGLALAGDFHVGYGMKVAWFKDPDGNILNVVSR